VETSAISGIVAPLEQIGLVERVHDRDDRRVVKIVLTAEGCDSVGSLNPLMANLNHQLLPPDQSAAVIQSPQALIARAVALTSAKASTVPFSATNVLEEA